MSIISDIRTKLDIARDHGRPATIRAFAVAELVCQPVSLLTVLAAVVFAILGHAGVWTPPATISAWMIPILVSAG